MLLEPASPRPGARCLAGAVSFRNDDDMLEILLALGLLLAIVLVARSRRKRGAKSDRKAPERGPLDAWIEEQVAHALVTRHGLEREAVLSALRGNPDPDVVSSVEKHVRSVQLGFERLATFGEIELQVDIAFEEGGTTTLRKRIRSDEMPEAVRTELERSAGTRVYRPWYFPWSSPDRVFIA